MKTQFSEVKGECGVKKKMEMDRSELGEWKGFEAKMMMTIERLISVKILFRFFCFLWRIDLDGQKDGDFDLVEVEFRVVA